MVIRRHHIAAVFGDLAVSNRAASAQTVWTTEARALAYEPVGRLAQNLEGEANSQVFLVRCLG